MKKLFISAFLIVLSALLVLSGCAQDLASDFQGLLEGEEIQVEFHISSLGATRSSIFTSDDVVDGVNIYAYSDGILRRSFYLTEERMVVGLGVASGGFKYNFYALANVGQREAPFFESDIASMAVETSELSQNIPMAWSGSVHETRRRSVTVPVRLERLTARVDFSLDASAVDGMKVTSIRLLQAPRQMTPFVPDGNVASEVQDFDYASEEDLASVNGGGTASFYVFENMQGTLLPGNTDPWKKIPDSLGPGVSSVCTYLEIGTSFVPGSRFYGHVTYRLFLGADNITNFDLQRNHTYRVSLGVTEPGLDCGVDWKVDTTHLYRDRTKRNVDMYLAQRDTIPVAGDIQSFDFDPEFFDVVRLGNLDLVVSAKKKGVDTIFVDCLDDFGIEFRTKVAVNVKPPVLSVKWHHTDAPQPLSGHAVDSIYFSMDGENKHIVPCYLDSLGKELVKERFDPDLYDSLLAVTADYSNLSAEDFSVETESEECDIFLKRLPQSAQLGWIQFSALSPEVADCRCEAFTKDPFSSSGVLSSFESRGLLTNTNETFTMKAGKIYEFCASSFTGYFHHCSECTVPERGKLQAVWLYEVNGDMYLPCLDERFYGHIVNRHSWEHYSSPVCEHARFVVHVAIGGLVKYNSRLSATSPSSYSVVADWGHDHRAESPISQFEWNIVAGTDPYFVEEGVLNYNIGLGDNLYKLNTTTLYPTGLGDKAWYSAHPPKFQIVDVTNPNNGQDPQPVETPYSLPCPGYNIKVWYYSDIFPESYNWLGVGR